jgi:hypothetical protein
MFARRQFSLRTILVIIAFVALFLALRKAYVFDTHAASSTISRAWQMPSLFAGLTVAASLIGSSESRVKRSIALGAIIATIVAAELATEIAEGIRRTSTYWIWSATGRSSWQLY